MIPDDLKAKVVTAIGDGPAWGWFSSVCEKVPELFEPQFHWDGDSYRLGRIEVGRVFITSDRLSMGGEVSGCGSTGTYNRYQHGGFVSAERAARESVEKAVALAMRQV